jgi:hypothetical protein
MTQEGVVPLGKSPILLLVFKCRRRDMGLYILVPQISEASKKRLRKKKREAHNMDILQRCKSI